jgi:hypothetical protein
MLEYKDNGTSASESVNEGIHSVSKFATVALNKSTWVSCSEGPLWWLFVWSY